eukprot:4464512-Pyramimonas_sp.AAC.1
MPESTCPSKSHLLLKVQGHCSYMYVVQMVASAKCSCTEAENSSADVAAAAYDGQATETSSLVSMERHVHTL